MPQELAAVGQWPRMRNPAATWRHLRACRSLPGPPVQPSPLGWAVLAGGGDCSGDPELPAGMGVLG